MPLDLEVLVTLIRMVDDDVVPFTDTALFGTDQQRCSTSSQVLVHHVRQTLSNYQLLVAAFLLKPEPSYHSESLQTFGAKSTQWQVAT
ncbi:hypothetical protein D3C81_1815050 [compost metagenome]